ncbi:hypothetical protein ABZ904_39340 [Streptomyces sp. NPDC046900]|uniref:glycine cleavage system protein H n=1 Tax=Streptomyces sp. NPDC046900 TaxID=3155473 RepID=UPI0033CDAE97
MRYTSGHLWTQTQEGDPTIIRVGITDYAQDQFGDVISVTLPAVDTLVGAGETCTNVESTKSVSDIDAPVPGTNTALEEAPETINASPYGEGWLFEISLDAEPGAAALERTASSASSSTIRLRAATSSACSWVGTPVTCSPLPWLGSWFSVLGVAVIAAFVRCYWPPIEGEIERAKRRTGRGCQA